MWNWEVWLGVQGVKNKYEKKEDEDMKKGKENYKEIWEKRKDNMSRRERNFVEEKETVRK